MINLAGLGRTVAATAIILSAVMAPAKAQEVTEDQIKAARAAIAAIAATNGFDNILPNLAERLKTTLIQSSPNYQELITTTVDNKALELAARRADLEREAATIYAKTFTVEQLNAITTFYTSDAGKKLLNDGPIAQREMIKAADIWAAGVSRDLNAAATKELGATLNAGQQPIDGATTEKPAQ
ncbi:MULTISPECIES: DUF2059 domain-containing protein [unclassified Rhizobium]|uniref:DUF2059 domain-containing protein n=1 Tax=unclassified Rhizobium TaxID=2613769 RepID=UPI0007129424|nr:MULTISPECIES: DUF2059 domain-containing protein [unclassified Rhizobium]KQS98132.1 hypothetical protein ASG50_23445 [Rhizobium sp. Leaf386]KQT00395.1 hypothetical protein ASG42_06035 [Rhizobium sp. Leaf391]KQT97398.1 hypothetical protein ASG68_10765 [Rhizobium sp. Leaf453]